MVETGSSLGQPRVRDAFALVPGEPITEIALHALQAIDLVHSDGMLPQIVVGAIPWHEAPNVTSLYVRADAGRSPAIYVKTEDPTAAFAFLHEIGHSLDQMALGVPGTFASESDPLLIGWWQAIQGTHAYRVWERLAREGTQAYRLANGRTVSVAVNREYAGYAVRPREYFARSYARYIAMVSMDRRLRYDLEELLRIQREARLRYPDQWEGDDFLSVRETFDGLLERLGWKR